MESSSGAGDWRLQLRPRWRNHNVAGRLRSRCDSLSDRAAELFERESPSWCRPWERGTDYIHLILDRSPNSLWIFFEKHIRVGQLKSRRDQAVAESLEMHVMHCSCTQLWLFCAS